MSDKLREKLPFEEPEEIQLQGNLETFCPLIETVARELSFKDCKYEARQAVSKVTETFVWYNIFIIDLSAKVELLIGVLTLQSLGGNRTVLRVPPRSQWYEGDLSPDERLKRVFSESQYDEHFKQFIKSLEDRLTHYSLIVTRRKRLWQRFKEISEVVKAWRPW